MSSYGELIQQSFGRQNPALPTVVGNISEDPDKAARALDLAKATGVPGTAIYGDLEEFERNSKAAMASEIVAGNPQLADWAQRSPLNPVVANDDWGNLDSVSQKVSALQLLRPSRWAEALFDGDPLKRFREGGPLGSWLKTEDIKNYPVASAVAAGLGTPIELFIRGFTGVQMTAADAAANLGAALGAPGAGREAGAMIESAGMTGRTHQAAPVAAPMESYLRARPWIENGREPLPGALPEYDAFRAKQNATDLEALKDATADAQRSTLRERNPDLFADFIRQHTDAEISVSGEAVAALYGDKIPEASDGLLGWVPDINSKLALARETGGDVSIPLSDWLARVEPQVAQALHDDIRVRPGGITAREAALDAEATAAQGGLKPPPLPEEVPTIRAASALEPMFSIGDRKLTLKREAAEAAVNEYEIKPDTVSILDDKGAKVGNIDITPFDGGKKLYVDMITGVNGLGPQDFGPALMRSVLRQLKELYPEAEAIGGYRVTGARGELNAKDVWINVDNPKGWDSVDTANEFRRILEGGEWTSFSKQTQAYYKPYAERSMADRQITDAVRELLGRIIPEKMHFVDAVDRIVTKGAHGNESKTIEPTGIYIRNRAIYPTILVSLEGPDPIGSAAHESIHHLRNYGFFRPEEWAALERGAIEGGWLEKHGIDRRYDEGGRQLQLEEAIAEEFADWRRDPENRYLPPEVRTVFERLLALYEAIKAKVGELLGKEPTVEDLFKRVEAGDIGRRKGTEPLDPGVFNEKTQAPKEPQDLGPRVFERAAALGMTVDQFQRYEALIAKRHAEDIAAATKRAEQEKARELTKEWKENRKALRQEIADDIRLRPDVAADLFFGAGELYGKKVPLASVKLDAAALTEAQKAALPKQYYGARGMHPDDVAGLFGYSSGDTMLAKLTEYNAAKMAAGMSAKDFVSRVVDIETDRQMRIKYGVLEDNIVDAVKEQVAGETQLDILHEETTALGMRAGGGPLDKATIQAQLREQFSRMTMADARSDAYLRAAGKAGRAAEMALLAEDPATAFRAKQQQYYATVIAGEAAKLEREAAKFDKLIKRLSRREVPQVEPEYLDYIHDLLQGAGVLVRRTPEDIAGSKEHYGNGSLIDFREAKNADGWDLAVTDRVAEGIGKRLEDMTVEEWREFNDAVTSLNHVGRAVRKIEIAGEKRDWDEFRQEVIANIRELPARGRSVQNRWLYKIDASLTRMEELVKDLDLRKELGPLFSAVIDPMMRSKSKEFDLMTDLSKHFQETRGEFGGAWRKSLRKAIDQDLLVDPYTGAPYDMTRENLIQVMLNWGNRSNIEKLVAGAGMAKYGRRLTREEMGVYEAQIKALIDQHATAEDWKFVQRMWEPFKGWQAQMDTVARNTSGIAPKWIKTEPVQTPHGTFEGGYWPVKYDRLSSNLSVIEDRKAGEATVFGANYFRAATAKGYLKERTGYVDFVDISTSIEQAAGTMQQTIHDIAFRDALIQAGKVFYDKQIRAAIRKHYGAEYEAQLIPWLRRIAHQYSADDAAISGINDFLRRVRINLVSHTLPLNLKVILSPDIGVPNPQAWATYLANREANVKLAMEKSEEIRHLVYNMDRDYNDALAKATQGTEIGEVRKKAIEWGFWPVAKVSQEFRVSTFVDQYYKALGRGFPDAQAAKIADSFVRERHGAASVVDLPAAMQSNESMKMLTMFYGYFNTMYNWQRQMVGNARRGEVKNFMVNGLGSVVVGAAFGAALFNDRKKDDSWFKIIGKAMVMQPLATIPIVNLATNYAFEGYAPRIPFASMLTAAGNIISDSKKWWKGQRVEKPITHGANVVGLATGLPLAQVGRTTQFGSDVAQGRQRPRNIGEWARGIITGEARLKK